MRYRAIDVVCLLFFASLGHTLGKKFKSRGNPLVSNFAAGDPSAHAWNGTVWVYCSKDANLKTKGLTQGDFTYEYMDGYHLMSTTNMVDWVDHGEVFHSRNVAWGPSGWMWAPTAAWNGKDGKDSKYYLYFPHKDWKGDWRIGVATAPSPKGPFTDIGAPLEGINGIDPKVFIDTDKKKYLYFNSAAVVRLKDNFIETAEAPRSIDYGALYHEEKFRFEEGSYMHKKGGVYYYSYSNWQAKDTTAYYATGSSPYGPFEWKGALAGKKSGAQDHHSIVQFKSKWYYFYHMDTPWEYKKKIEWYGQRRIVCFTEMSYSSANTIEFVTPKSMLINSGGSLFSSKAGSLYQWDIWYSTGNSGPGQTDAVIKGTTDATLYKTHRFGNSFSYDIPLRDGRYRITFKFAETYHDAIGRRIFNVAAEGNQVISNLDIFSVAGKNKAYDLVRLVTVTGNELNIAFSTVTDNALISALRVDPVY